MNEQLKVAFDEYKQALSVALKKRKEYTRQYCKELLKDKQNMTEEVLNNITETCTVAFFARMQGDNIEDEIDYTELIKL